jgi:hypothetical protein
MRAGWTRLARYDGRIAFFKPTRRSLMRPPIEPIDPGAIFSECVHYAEYIGPGMPTAAHASTAARAAK